MCEIRTEEPKKRSTNPRTFLLILNSSFLCYFCEDQYNEETSKSQFLFVLFPRTILYPSEERKRKELSFLPEKFLQPDGRINSWPITFMAIFLPVFWACFPCSLAFHWKWKILAKGTILSFPSKFSPEISYKDILPMLLVCHT